MVSFGNLAWFTTPTGKFYMKIAAGAATCGVFSAHLFPQVIFLDTYRNFVGLRKNGMPYPLNTELQKTYNKVLNDLKLPESRKLRLEPFMVYGFDVWHAGIIDAQSGAKIGLPITYIYKKPTEIDKSGIVINDDFVNWNRKEAQSLLQSLILSENAKKFSIAREIFMVQSYNSIIQSFISGFLAYSYYLLARSINTRMGLYERPRLTRFIIYGLLGIFVWGVWAMQKDAMTKYYEHNADEQASKLGIDYVKGGLEFYSKVIQRNIALRELGGSNGAKSFTKGGNETVTFREKHIPNTVRKQFFNQALTQYAESDVSNIEAEPVLA